MQQILWLSWSWGIFMHVRLTAVPALFAGMGLSMLMQTSAVTAGDSQRDLDAVALIALYHEPVQMGQGKRNMRFERRGEQLTVIDTSFGSAPKTFVYTKESGCRYRVQGAPENGGFHHYDATLDFTDASIAGITSRQEKTPLSPDGKTMVMTIPGITYCRAKDTTGIGLYNVAKRSGECQQGFSVEYFNQQMGNRIIVALKYLQSTACGGSAF
jgi:hypothetical protein